MTAETDLLPLPDDHCGSDDYPRYDAEQVQAYARACVSSATEALRAEVERLKDLVRSVGYETLTRAEQAEARAERLAEALRVCKDALGKAVVRTPKKFQYHTGQYLGAIEAAEEALEQEAGRE